MHVLALVSGRNHACYRYRIQAFAGPLAEGGYSLEAVPLRRNSLRRALQLRAARRAEVVILQRKLLPLWQLWILRRSARRLLYDFDDALFQRDSYSGKGPASWRRAARFRATTAAADAVTAGNDYLAQQAAAWTRSDRIRVIPTCVEPARYRLANHHRTNTAARLVWIGQPSTLASLRSAESQLAAAAAELPGLELRVICDGGAELAGVRVVPRRWASDTEAAELADGDIGVNWLPDDAWSRGKCGLKVLQYMAAGLPVVANPVGMNRQMVIHGRTGFLASTAPEWAAAISRLAADPELRQQMGRAGRELVERHFSVTRWAPEVAAVIASLGAGRPGGKTPSGAIRLDMHHEAGTGSIRPGVGERVS